MRINYKMNTDKNKSKWSGWSRRKENRYDVGLVPTSAGENNKFL